MSCYSKDIFKNDSVSCTNNHHDITDLVNHGMVKSTKTRISQKQNLLFLRNKKILNFLKNIKTQISQKQNLLFSTK